MLICKGRDTFVNLNLVCLFTLSLAKNILCLTTLHHSISPVSYNFQVLVLLFCWDPTAIKKTKPQKQQEKKNLPNLSIVLIQQQQQTLPNYISIVLPLEGSEGILRLPPQNSPICPSTCLCSSSFPFFSFYKKLKNKHKRPM